MTGKTREVLGTLACAFVVLAVGSAGALFMGSLEEWYPALGKPSFNPPNWLFGPVWTALYLMIGVALWLVVRRWREDRRTRPAVLLFCVQFALNLAWTPVFFGMRSPFGGLIVIGMLLPSIAASLVLFARVSKPAALLLVPYLLWVSFATVLNAAIVALN